MVESESVPLLSGIRSLPLCLYCVVKKWMGLQHLFLVIAIIPVLLSINSHSFVSDKCNFMDHSDDQSDFAPDDELLMQQEIMLLKMKAFHNSKIMEEEYEILQKEIREKYSFKHLSDD